MADFCTATREALEPIIKKKLSDKLLQKPPFKFLHDVITQVSAATGFLAGTISEEEKSADSITVRFVVSVL